jgi:hypothetical protein
MRFNLDEGKAELFQGGRTLKRTLPITDCELGHIYNMKNQFWAGLGSRPVHEKKVWGR